ncbi:MAG: hypothetical protein PHX41_00500 [Kiritimatiellae bacterium]|nr:hypothetical protein [Kiritimatiellia bacterium]
MMRTSRELIERALAAQRVTRRTKVRMSRDLYERAAVCAREVDETVSRWMELCTRPGHLERAQAAGVAVPDEWLSAARDGVVATVDGEHADHGRLRLCVATVVLWCESRRLPPVACAMREGVDYYLERGE